MDEMLLEIKHLKSYFFTRKGISPAVDDVSLQVPKVSGPCGRRGDPSGRKGSDEAV